MKYNKHIFICTNEREKCSIKGDCASLGSKEIRMKFVQLINEHGLKGKVRANKSGCLDACEMGTALVIYPKGIWYTKVTKSDVREIFNKSILQDEVVERLKGNKDTWGQMMEIRRKNQVKA
ncbi:MAG: (2Fe-2S) ferredoxin domain-containing protein [Candidatus Marinimicrobia bacterium]|jgi:(2Fe-2S) ferredoxin|nr:(2Fe-2S) ferredoxin domain-containing protein [Candidatus Neomarinimicrobiota bacterium]MBT4317778.1 (2Fe-2S) ferredoxin domain-containing protein [Candidatus Neomarinimicrobiota bacterium]MBT4783968.1 (2Fe-2S) ferredoxin domain-containing protein [Candidatus Neomarinimicrobiota bacterium]MBT5097113.1 (2Fe-2S) ferredoxin domain-containing protein [Candidatus Neomarinimicrobiota bacterium]MBT5440896.1 (2Fe-2S) ferredoxin domain-containing protein [Candidatus Neomarinimicrobiota bacterium]|tara:strand:+ start:4851 stop:5213 length:363 start_codon:yes stop_codon:yes gene_type:complete